MISDVRRVVPTVQSAVIDTGGSPPLIQKVVTANKTYWRVRFEDNQDDLADWHIPIPLGYAVGGVRRILLTWISTSIVGSTSWSVQTKGHADGSTWDVALNAAITTLIAAPGVAGEEQTVAIDLSGSTEWLPGGTIDLRIKRNGTTDTINAHVDLLVIVLEISDFLLYSDNPEVYTNGEPGILAEGDAVAINAGTAIRADAGNAAKRPAVGIAHKVNTGFVAVQQYGRKDGYGGLVAGTRYFLASGTPGAITATEPTSPNWVQSLGRALSAGVLIVNAERPERQEQDLTGNVALAGPFPISVTVNSYIMEGSELYLNGMRQRLGDEWNRLSSTTIQLTATFLGLAADELAFVYFPR